MRWKDDRGSYTIETLFLFPVLLIFFVLTFWFGGLMFTWSAASYTVMQYSLDIAKTGENKTEFRDAAADRLRTLPFHTAKEVDSTAASSENNPDAIVLWGPAVGQTFNRGEMITTGAVIPVRIPSPLLAFIGKTVFGRDTIYLKASSTARSEVYFER